MSEISTLEASQKATELTSAVCTTAGAFFLIESLTTDKEIPSIFIAIPAILAGIWTLSHCGKISNEDNLTTIRYTQCMGLIVGGLAFTASGLVKDGNPIHVPIGLGLLFAGINGLLPVRPSSSS